jgi:protein-L-isoaspartate(D-aspartate) O-methyltransferase
MHRYLLTLSAICLFVAPAAAQSLENWEKLADRMVDEEIVAAGVTNPRVIAAMRDTPRHAFVPSNRRQYAYYDMALPIGSQQTISPPFIVAYMTEVIDPQPTDRVLEIGTGSGYQAAILSPLAKDVYTIEIVESLGRKAGRTLERLGYKNVHTRIGDGFQGWPEAAPFDKIIVTCSPEQVPEPLVEQLAEGGRMVIPVGERYQQNLYLYRKENGELKSESLKATLFVPMTGEAESQRSVQPDPAHPAIVNGSFEETVGDEEPLPAGWHYIRQATIEADPEHAPHGKNILTFRNQEPGRGCQALQGFAVDGRKVSALRLSLDVRGREIRHGETQTQWPSVVVTFYDERRAFLRDEIVGPFYGSFDWRQIDAVVPVPIHAREAVLRVGLLGAVGELSTDHLEIGLAAPGN